MFEGTTVWEKFSFCFSETRHFGVLLEIPRLQIKGLVKPDKLPGGGRWVYEAFASRWKNDHGSVLCAGLRVPVIPVKVDRDCLLYTSQIFQTLFSSQNHGPLQRFKAVGLRITPAMMMGIMVKSIPGYTFLCRENIGDETGTCLLYTSRCV